MQSGHGNSRAKTWGVRGAVRRKDDPRARVEVTLVAREAETTGLRTSPSALHHPSDGEEEGPPLSWPAGQGTTYSGILYVLGRLDAVVGPPDEHVGRYDICVVEFSGRGLADHMIALASAAAIAIGCLTDHPEFIRVDPDLQGTWEVESCEKWEVPTEGE